VKRGAVSGQSSHNRRPVGMVGRQLDGVALEEARQGRSAGHGAILNDIFSSKLFLKKCRKNISKQIEIYMNLVECIHDNKTRVGPEDTGPGGLGVVTSIWAKRFPLPGLGGFKAIKNRRTKGGEKGGQKRRTKKADKKGGQRRRTKIERPKYVACF